MSSKHGKRYKELKEKLAAKGNSSELCSIDDACGLVVEFATTKFDESIDMALHLGVDAKKSDQNVRGSVSLPHGLGKSIRVAVFADGDLAEQAKAAGADKVGTDDLAEEMKAGKLDYDVVVATPDQMVNVGKIGKILGPKGLMPSPKVGTVTRDVAETVKAVKAGMAEFKLDKAGIVHVSIGKASMGKDKLKENLEAVFVAISKAKPQSSKGQYLKKASLSSTMGPGIAFDLSEVRA